MMLAEIGRGLSECAVRAAPRYALVYPARGDAAAANAAGPDAMSALFGPGRARMVCELARPATSTQLAELLGVSLGTVSGHLAVLRDSGVVTGAGAGHHVVYHLTERGAALGALLDEALGERRNGIRG
jgi:DNA-binding transcriptional ArsR family regulator